MKLLYRPAFVAGLLLAATLAGCASTPASPQPTSQPATAAPAPTSLPVPTNPPAPTAVPPTAAPPAQPAPADPDGAVQTILNYYDAIAQRQPERAYGYWANDGAASGQTLEQFQQGFANTAGIDLQLGSPAAQGANVALPVTLAAVNNNPSGGDQQVQHFSGTYTMQPDAGSDTGWRIAAANIAEGPGTPTDPTDPNGAVQTLKDYYDAISRREYAHAYTLWSNLGAASNQSFTQFEQGFATTTGVTIATGTATGGGAAGSTYVEVPILIHSASSDQGAQTFCGTYTLRHTNVPPFDQFGWHIDKAEVAQVANVAPGSPEAQQLLNNGCK